MAKNNKVLLAAVAGLLAVGAVTTTAGAADEAKGGKVKCYGANKCKGSSACGTAGHGQGCAGKNACKGQGFVEADSAEACLKMDGGRLTPDKK